ncbi:DUF262 domain-containing HNH endonuclease family protein [Micromonospora sp. DR5-3]|uniref:DUF262 domain-containing protein n=1 Tax=unclassified Micromonospora TaxID=2617518 RepID=UPI0011D5ABD8|nr:MULTISPECIES: DUF262 domain-containing protein [unclassified Micromonospora]MCW3817845.1 DUF262 domain-containing HNH endonuclease family protein [Micromonospora sp. DR5-3]TYC12768.1 DUF262 domain-containing protein [Micromonospora sp. MP36]
MESVAVEVEIESLFRPSSASIRQLLSDMAGGFAIPSYQRPYRWKPADIKRLFESVIIGLERLVDDVESVTFIGAMITVSGVGSQHKTRPKDPRQVIDGQQRLSTVLLIAAAAHETLKREAQNVKREIRGEQEHEIAGWLLDQCGEIQEQLLGCLADVKTYGDPDYKMLPKIVREIADIWSTKQESARYISPVSHLLHEYLQCARTDSQYRPSVPNTAIMPEGVGSSQQDHELLHRRFATIQGLIKDVAGGREGELADAVNLEILLAPKSKVLSGLFGDVTEDHTPNLRLFTSHNPKAANVLRLMLFSRFLLERVSLTQINARNEEYAFELFESLNSTGEPLTSFETFIPLVVEREGPEKYVQTPSYQHVSLTSKLLSERGDAVQTETARLITSFLLSDAGQKVAAKHNEQRRALSKRYNEAENQSQRRDMTQQLADNAFMYFKVWRNPAHLVTLAGSGPHLTLDAESQFALGFLREIKHTIVLAPLARYFSAFRATPDPFTLAEFQRAVKACAAFSILWRASHGGTDGIDTRYRALMRDGVQDEAQATVVGPIARTRDKRHDVNPLPPATSFAAGLRTMARTARTYFFSDRSSFIKAAETRPVYDENELARVLLLLSAHHSVPAGTSGHTKDGVHSDSTDMLRPERWNLDDRLVTIEHVAPKVPRVPSGWSKDVYEDSGLVHRLGNLVLLPLDDNAFLSNRNWWEKRFLYGALAADDPDQTEKMLHDAEKKGVKVSKETREKIIARRRHLPMLETISLYEGEWNRAFIEERTRRLLGRAYDVLSTWLG